MNKKLLVIIALIGVFALTFSVVAAQGGNGRGGPNGNGGNTSSTTSGGQYGNGGTNCDPATDCIPDPQNDNYNYNSNQWNSRNRQGGYMNGGGGILVDLPPAYDGELPDEIIDLMIDGWLDEQGAYATYQVVIDTFGSINPFVNIQRAEAQHIAAWEFLFERYDIEAPNVPEFPTPVFDTIADACSAAAEAEIVNFDLYDTMLENFAEYPDIYQIALALRNASEFSHLPAFENCAN